ncbi:hypothetical protein NVV95_03060 [Herbiconiux sp. CPCC 205716]|uniref:Uncharacterized protein n=1 Tax=Herbiconiux gentiana TaxID=2970912 RepID=A0ABT2GBF0_9MICO|nr:hypothetical protein [Herbiconiux gentiana]MCS5713530.1 hypothetical protein [Herbiconiux gentiana]
MARIRSISEGTQNVREHPTEVDCSFQIIQSEQGSILHLSTFGSDERVSGPKSSQSLQLDKRSAARLIDVIRLAFPELTN